jgi:CelD/BcsL family acetyltransferase involved in cellulose biosynthesis
MAESACASFAALIETASPASAVESHDQIEWSVESSATLPVVELEQLWRSDPFASPFAAPAFLTANARRVQASGGTVVMVRAIRAGATVGLWPLRLDAGSRRLTFLQDDHADHCTCLAAPGITAETLGRGLAVAIRTIKPLSIAFKNVPPWGATLAAIKAGLDHTGWSMRAFPATPCPVLRTEPGPGALDEFRQEMNGHKRLRNYENRLKRLPGYAFELLDDGTDLEGWTTQFCDVHEWRWNRTDTPSQFVSAAARAELLRELTASAQDGVLRRFSIVVGGRRIAMVAALVGGGRLVYHRPASAPGWSDTRPGHVLIRQIGLWMADAGLHILDFGVGDEDYKTRYAKCDDTLWRVFATRRSLSLTMARGTVEERIRRSPRAQQHWDRWINRVIKGTLRRRVADFRDRLEGGRLGWWSRSASDSALPMILYRASGSLPSTIETHPGVRAIDPRTLLNARDGARPTGRADIIEHVYGGAQLLALFEQDAPIVTGWLADTPAAAGAVAPDDQKSYRVDAGELTGAGSVKGSIGRFLRGVRALVGPGASLSISIPRTSSFLRHELLSAGFEPVELPQ